MGVKMFETLMDDDIHELLYYKHPFSSFRESRIILLEAQRDKTAWEIVDWMNHRDYNFAAWDLTRELKEAGIERG